VAWGTEPRGPIAEVTLRCGGGRGPTRRSGNRGVEACTRQTHHPGNWEMRACTRQTLRPLQAAGESVERKLEARATAQRERGRDEPISWGTADSASSRKQTHRVGNQAVRACDTNSFAWRKPCGESVVGRVGRSGNRAARSSETKSLFGKPEGGSVVRTESPCRYRARVTMSGGTRAKVRATESARAREVQRIARATARWAAPPGPSHRKATGGESGSRARRFGRRLESSSRWAVRRRDARLLSGWRR